jgi:hypothetical protein
LLTNAKPDGASVKSLDAAIELAITHVFIDLSGRVLD